MDVLLIPSTSSSYTCSLVLSSKARTCGQAHHVITRFGGQSGDMRRTCWRWRTVNNIFLIIIFVVHLLLSNSATVKAIAYHSDNCDWHGSGITPSQARLGAVDSVSLACSSGELVWTYPSGVVRVLLQLTPGGSRDFRGCFKMATSSKTKMATTLPLMYVEREEKLVKIEVKADEEYCFTSEKGKLPLFMEARPGQAPTKLAQTVKIEYELEDEEEYQRIEGSPSEACRPCSQDELAMAYCTSDFVVKGEILDVSHDYTKSDSEILVSAWDVVRQSGEVFTWALDKSSHTLTGTVHKPLECGVKRPSKPGQHFLLMGSIRLGRAHLACSPTVVQWKQVRERALKRGEEPCQL